MALNIDQIQALSVAIKNYSHPTGYFNFNTNTHVEVANIKEIEEYIGNLLISEKREDLAHGLVNILYPIGRKTPSFRSVISGGVPIGTQNLVNSPFKACYFS